MSGSGNHAFIEQQVQNLTFCQLSYLQSDFSGFVDADH